MTANPLLPLLSARCFRALNPTIYIIIAEALLSIWWILTALVNDLQCDSDSSLTWGLFCNRFLELLSVCIIY